MRESRQSFWVGLFVLAGLAALGVLIVLFGRAGFWGRRADAYVLNVRLERATGIRAGTITTVGGIPVGRVSAVGFVDPNRFEEGVNVEIVFDKGYRLPEGSRAKTSEPGLGMGRPPISIEPGAAEAPLLASGATIPGEISSAMESLFPKAIVTNFETTATRIGELAAALTPVAQDVHEILRPREVDAVDRPGGPPGNLASAITRLDAGLKHWNDVLGDPEVKSRLREAINNLHTMSEDGKVAVAEMKQASRDVRAAAEEAKTMVKKGTETITRIDGHVGHLARSATDGLEIASEFFTRINSIAERIDRGEGTIGRLLMDERFYESLVLTFRRLSEAVEEFRLLAKQWQERGMKVRGAL